MVSSCYLCNRKASKVDNISLHRFPRNVVTREKWLNACGLTTNDDVKRTCICSIHFASEDVCESKIFGSVKAFIKRSAVPKLFLTNPLDIEMSMESPSKTPLMKPFNKNAVANQSSLSSESKEADDNIKKRLEKCYKLSSIQMSNTSTQGTADSDEKDSNQCITNMTDSRSKDTVDPDKNDSNQCIKNMTDSNSKHTVNPDESDSNQRIKNIMIDSSSKDEETVPDGNNFSSNCKKRRFFEPRYVNEISLLDFVTPRRANKTIQFIKETDENKSKKIKQLQRQARELQKRVKFLQDLIHHLKKKRKLIDKSKDALMV